jgi:hypothetical protein
MIKKLRVGKWRFTFTFAPVTDVVGVNSNLPDGDHILMWDFDGVPLRDVILALDDVQEDQLLPNIYILNTGKRNHHIAYCFERCPWRVAVKIIADTPKVDWNFFKYGVYRGHFTLRVSDKNHRKIKLVKVLKGLRSETASVLELKSWTKYETLEG